MGKNKTRFNVALTGGIASGKTAVSDGFGKRGVHIIDTDVIAHEMVEPGSPALQAITQAFGLAILDQHGQLDRSALRALIFEHPGQRKRLEAILHPAILSETVRRLDKDVGLYSMVVIPLLAEVGRRDWVDRVLVVDVNEAVQVQRVMARDGIDQQQAEQILAAQASREERLALADDIIDNSGTLDELNAAVDVLHHQYLELAGQ